MKEERILQKIKAKKKRSMEETIKRNVIKNMN